MKECSCCGCRIYHKPVHVRLQCYAFDKSTLGDNIARVSLATRFATHLIMFRVRPGITSCLLLTIVRRTAVAGSLAGETHHNNKREKGHVRSATGVRIYSAEGRQKCSQKKRDTRGDKERETHVVNVARK